MGLKPVEVIRVRKVDLVTLAEPVLKVVKLLYIEEFQKKEVREIICSLKKN